MEEKQREQKRARTVRSDYLTDLDEVQSWIRQAELKVQDRSIEPIPLKEQLKQVQDELGTIIDKLERLTRNGRNIAENTRDDTEKQLIDSTVHSVTEQLNQVRNWLDERKQVVADTIDAWQRFLTLYEAIKTWTEEKRQFLVEPLKLSTLVQARQRLHEYSIAVKSCKQINKNLSDMGKELESIGQVCSVGDLPEKLLEAEEAKVQVEGQLLERNALLQETSEEWEQCERKMKEVKTWIEKAKQNLESPQNKKKPLRDQHIVREKMLSDVAIQKTKIGISMEKLQVHFRSGIGGDSRIGETVDELLAELDSLHTNVKEQTAALEACLTQIDQYQQEIQQLRQQIMQVEQQLRTVLSPTYLSTDKEKALQEQQSLQQRMDDWKQRAKTLLDQIYAVDPYFVQSNETRLVNQVSYADIAAGRSSPSSRGSSPFRNPSRDEASSTPLSIQVLKPTVQLSRTIEAPKQPAVEPIRDDALPNVARVETKTKEEQTTKFEEQSELDARAEVRRHVSKVDSVSSRLRNQPRRSGSAKKDVQERIRESRERTSSAEADFNETLKSETVRSVVEQKKEPLTIKNTLAPKIERRGRSASPIWVPGSTSYADILRGNRQSSRSPSVETGKDAHVAGREIGETVVEESSETVQEKIDFQVPRLEVEEEVVEESSVEEQPAEDTSMESYQQQPAEVVPEVLPEVVREVASPVETVEKPSDAQADWRDETMDEYVLLNEKSYENVSRQPVAATQQVPEVYSYIHPPITELVGFIGSQIAYPVSSYVYMPAAPPQQMALPHYTESQIAFTSEPYVTQGSYISEPEIYQQSQLQKHSQRQPHQSKFKAPPKSTPVVVQNVEEKCLPSRIQQPVDVESSIVQPVQAEEVPEEPETPVEPEQSVQQPVQRPAQPVSESTPVKTKITVSSESKTFSYAQILSQGLNPKPTSSATSGQSPTTTTFTSRQEDSHSPANSTTSSVHETSPPQEARQVRESSVGKQRGAWDTSRRRETRKTHQESPKTRIPEKKARRGSHPRTSPGSQKGQKEKPRTNTEQKKQVLEIKDDEIPVKDSKVVSEVIPKSSEVQIEREKVDDVKPEIKQVDVEKSRRIEAQKQDEKNARKETEADVQQRSTSQEKKRKGKKKKTEKQDDEIEKALKEIEDMDKHKRRDKSREQAKKDAVQNTAEKAKEESEKKNVRSGERKKQNKSKLEKVKDEPETALNQKESNIKEQLKSKGDAKESKEEKDSEKKNVKDDVKDRETKIEEDRKKEPEKKSEARVDAREEKCQKEPTSKKKQKGREQPAAVTDKSNKDTKPTRVDIDSEQVKRTSSEDKVETQKQKDVKSDTAESVQNLERMKKEDTKIKNSAKPTKTSPEIKVESKDKPRSESKEKEPMKLREQEKSNKRNKKQKQGHEQEVSKDRSRQKKSEIEKSEVTKDVELDEKREVKAEVRANSPKDDKDKKVAGKEKGKKDEAKDQKSEVTSKADNKEEQKAIISALIRVIESTMGIGEADESTSETVVQENVEKKPITEGEEKQDESGEEQTTEGKDSERDTRVPEEEPKKVVESDKQTKSKGKKSKKEQDVNQKLAAEVTEVIEKDEQIVEEKLIEEEKIVTEESRKEYLKESEAATPNKEQSGKKKHKKSKSPMKAKKEESSKLVEENEKSKEKKEEVEAVKLEEESGKIDTGRQIFAEEMRKEIITEVKEEIGAIQIENQREENIVDVIEKTEVESDTKNTIIEEKPIENVEISGIEKSSEESKELGKVEISDVEKEEEILSKADTPNIHEPERKTESSRTSSKSKKASKSKEICVIEKPSPVPVVESREESKSSQPSTPKSDKKKKKKQESKDKVAAESPQPERKTVIEKPSADVKSIEQSVRTKISEVTPEKSTGKVEPFVTSLTESEDKEQDTFKEVIREIPKSDECESQLQDLIGKPSTTKDPSLSKKEEAVEVLDTVSLVERSRSPEKSSIVEKAVTSTVASIETEPFDEKLAKSVENVENIPSFVVVDSKSTELITLRPDTVETSLTTEHARVLNDSAVGIPSKVLDTFLADVDKSISDYATYIDDLVKDDQPILFGSVQDRRRGRSGTPKSVESAKDERELDVVEKEQDAKISQGKSEDVSVESKTEDDRTKLVQEEIKVIGETASVELKDSSELVVESEGKIVEESLRLSEKLRESKDLGEFVVESEDKIVEQSLKLSEKLPESKDLGEFLVKSEDEIVEQSLKLSEKLPESKDLGEFVVESEDKIVEQSLKLSEKLPESKDLGEFVVESEDKIVEQCLKLSEKLPESKDSGELQLESEGTILEESLRLSEELPELKDSGKSKLESEDKIVEEKEKLRSEKLPESKDSGESKVDSEDKVVEEKQKMSEETSSGVQQKEEFQVESREISLNKKDRERVDELVEVSAKFDISKSETGRIEDEASVVEGKKMEKVHPYCFTDLVKPYWFDYRPYIEAEIDFHRRFKVVKVIEENVPASTISKSKSIEKIVQESVMRKPEKLEDAVQSEAECRKLSLLRETLKYPISTFYELESEWAKSKQTVKEKEVTLTSLELANVEVTEEEMQAQEEEGQPERLEAGEVSEEEIKKEKTIAEITTEITKSTDIILDQTAALIENVNKELYMLKKEKEQNMAEGKIKDGEEKREIEIQKKKEQPDRKSKEKSKKEKQVKDEKSKAKKEEKREIKSPEAGEPEVIEKKDEELIKVVEPTTTVKEEIEETSLPLKESEIIEKKDVEELNKTTVTTEEKETKEEDSLTLKELDVARKEDVAVVEVIELTQKLLVTKLDEIVDQKEETKLEKGITKEEPLIALESNVDEEIKLAAEKAKEETKLKEDKREQEKQGERKEIISESEIPAEKKLEKMEKPVCEKKKASKESKKKENAKQMTKEEKLSTEEKPSSQEFVTVAATTTTDKEPEIKDAPQSPVKEDKIKPADKPKKEEAKTKSSKQKQPKDKPDVKAKSVPEKETKKHERQEIGSPDSKKKRDGKSRKTSEIPQASVPQETLIEISPEETKQEETKQEETQAETKEVSKEEVQSICAKSWASVVGTKGTIDTTNLSAENAQTSDMKATTRESTTESPKLEKIEQTVETVPDEPQTQHKKHQKKKEVKQEKIVTETKAEKENEVKSAVPEKVEELESTTKESNKSYAQVAASSKRTSPQTSQEEGLVLLKPIPLVPDQSENREVTLEESLDVAEISHVEEISKSEEITITDQKFDELITEENVLKMDSTSWVEEIEKEAMADDLASPLSPVSNEVTETETSQKTKDSWAAIVSKHVEPLEPLPSPVDEKVTAKKEQIIEQHLHPQVQIHVEEAPEPVPIEEVVQIDEQGFIEFVNRKQLRSRRSRSRSRSARREETSSRQSSDKPIVPEEILADEQRQISAQRIEEQKKKNGSKGKEGKSKDKSKGKSSNADRNQVTKDEQGKSKEKGKGKEKMSEFEEREDTGEKVQKLPEKKDNKEEEDSSKTKEVNLSQEKIKEKVDEKLEEIVKVKEVKEKEETEVPETEKVEEEVEAKEVKEEVQIVKSEVPEQKPEGKGEIKEIKAVKPESPEIDKANEIDKKNVKPADKWKKTEIKEQPATRKNKKSKKGKSDKEQPKEETENKEPVKQPDIIRMSEIESKSKDEIKEIRDVSETTKTEPGSKPEIVEEIKSEKSTLARKPKGKFKEKKAETVAEQISETTIEEKKVSEFEIKKEILAKESHAKDKEIIVKEVTKSDIESKSELVEGSKTEKRKGKSKEKKIEIVPEQVVKTPIEEEKVELPAKEPEIGEIIEVQAETKEKSAPAQKHKGKSKEKKVETVPERVNETSVEEKKILESEIKEVSIEEEKREIKEGVTGERNEIDSNLEEKRELVEKKEIKEEPIKPSSQTSIEETTSNTKTDTKEVKEEQVLTEEKSKLSKKEKRKQKKKEKSATRATSEEKLRKETLETIVTEKREETSAIAITPEEVKQPEDIIPISPDENETKGKLEEIKKLTTIISEVVPDEIKLVPETILKPIIKEKERSRTPEKTNLPKSTEEKEKVPEDVENLTEEKVEIPKSVTDKSETLKSMADDTLVVDVVQKPETLVDESKLMLDKTGKDIKQEESIPTLTEKSKRKNKQARKTKHEEQETAAKSTDEEPQSSKDEKDTEILSTDSIIPTTPETPKEIVDQKEDVTISEEKIELDLELKKLEIDEKPTIEEVKKDEKEVKNVSDEEIVLKETVIEEKTETEDFAESQKEIDSVQETEEIPKEHPPEEETTKEEKKGKDKTHDTPKDDEKKISEENPPTPIEEISDKTAEIKEDEIISLEEIDSVQETEEIPKEHPSEEETTKEEKKGKDKTHDTPKDDEKKISEEILPTPIEEISDKTAEIKEDEIISLEEIEETIDEPAAIIVNSKLAEETGKEEIIEKKETEEIVEIQSGIVKELESIIQGTDQVPLQEISIEKLLDEIESPITIDSIQSQLETEEEFEKCISSEPEIETVDIVIEPAKPKVQFYIADEILVLSPEKKKPVQTPLILRTLSELSRSKFLSLDSGFWPDKHPYHEAERYLFENLANYPKENLSGDAKRDSNDKDDFDGDNGGGLNDRGGNGGPLNSYFMGGPHTERLIADLPGGIGSWSDYSTYLSSENEQRPDQLVELVSEKIENPTSDPSCPSDDLVSELSSVRPNDDQSVSKFVDEPVVPTTSENFEEAKLSSLSTVEVPTSGEQPLKYDQSRIVSPDRRSESTRSDPCELSLTPSIPDHGPDPKELNLGRERGSMQRRTPVVETERETGVAEDEAEKRIRGIKDIIQERLMVLQLSVSNLKGTYLPRDSIDSMLSALTNLLTELQGYDREVRQLEEELRKIPADLEAQKLLSNLEEVQSRVATLLSQAEQGRATLEGARGEQEQRGHDIHEYKKFLDETDSWLKNIVAGIKQQQPTATNKALQDELSSHAQRVSELESLPEISTLAKVLKNALLEVMSRLQQRQQVSNVFQCSGAFANFAGLRATVS
ncbi:hypothetical protein K0M31_020493 [Melipona bicolor]|uniref:Nesprin-1 n=1 Tax=Melipona bicolor TaxID=60889 RepID=A0AA40FKA6_9HYME|nr:hypothetical protein K0M31_020493 [Melipona bicolor]